MATSHSNPPNQSAATIASSTKRALQLRRIFRKAKPHFTRQDLHKKSRLEEKWRKPKGLQSKMRQRLKHHKRVVKVGYKAPALARHYHRSGVLPVLVANRQEAEHLTKGQGAIIARTTGIRTKIEIIDTCEKAGIPVVNLNIMKFRTAIKQMQDAKQQAKVDRESKKESSKKESESAKKKAEKTAKTAEKETPTSSATPEEAKLLEEKKATEKKERDNALIHRS